MHPTRSIFAWACSVVLTGVASADVLHVPSEYATIQEAIDAAVDGDEIELAAGTYAEPIDLSGKNVTVRSADPSDPAVVEATILDFMTDPDANIRVLSLANTPSTIIDGVLLQIDNDNQPDSPDILVRDGALTILRSKFYASDYQYDSIELDHGRLSMYECSVGPPFDAASLHTRIRGGELLLESSDLTGFELYFSGDGTEQGQATIRGCVIERIESGLDVIYQSDPMPDLLIESCSFGEFFDAFLVIPEGSTCTFRSNIDADDGRELDLHMTARGGTLVFEDWASEPLERAIEAEEGGTIRIIDSTMEFEGLLPIDIEHGHLVLENSTIRYMASAFAVVDTGSIRLTDSVLENESPELQIGDVHTVTLSNTKGSSIYGDRPIRLVDWNGSDIGSRIEILDQSLVSLSLGGGADILVDQSVISGTSVDESSMLMIDSTILSLFHVTDSNFVALNSTYDGLRSSSGGSQSLDFRGCAVLMKDCLITGATGGAGSVLCAGTTNATFVDTRFHDNSGSSTGGVYTFEDASVALIRCKIEGNGGRNGPSVAFASGNSEIKLIACSASGNSLYGTNPDINRDVLFLNQSTRPIVVDSCTIWGNDFAGDPFNGNVLVTNSIIQDTGQPDPMFVRLPDPGDDGWYNWRNTPDLDEAANNDYGDLRLLPGSPAIDAGDSSLLPGDTYDLDADGDTAEPLPLDLDGNPRVIDDPATPDTGPVSPAVDLGAYEFQPACPADLTGDGVLNFDDIDAFVLGFLGGDLIADLDGNGVLNFDDIDAFVASFLAGCG